MDSLIKDLKKMNLSDEIYFGDDLSNEENFLKDVQKKVEQLNVKDFSFYCGKKVMSISVKKYSKADAEFANKLLFIVDSTLDIYFGQKKTLYQTGWCSSYMIDSRIINSNEKYEATKSFSEALQTNKSHLREFLWLNVSSNHKLFKKEGQKSSLFCYAPVLAAGNL